MAIIQIIMGITGCSKSAEKNIEINFVLFSRLYSDIQIVYV